MSYQVDSYGNAYFPAGVSVASIPATTGTQNKVLVPGPNGRISSASISQLITQSGGNLVSSIFGRTGVITALRGDYNTDQVTEGQALYFSNSRARKVISVTTFNTSGPATYDSTTGIINIPQYGSGIVGNYVPVTRTITINGQTADLSANRIFTIDAMVYPSVGIPLSNGTSWGTSIVNNSANWNTAFGWGNHAGLYSLLGHTHTFASLTSIPTTLAGYGITDAATSAQGANADTAFGWGNHALAGYLTSFTETDPTVPSHVKAITTTNITNWNTAYSWGNHSLAGYLTSFTETDPIWNSEKANYALKTYVDTSISNLIDSAPTTLDTLNELAAALGDDANFSTTVTTLIGTKEPGITPGTTLQYWRGDKTWQTLPIYTLSGLGGVPTTRTLTINGVSYDLTANRSWSALPVGGIAGQLLAKVDGTDYNAQWINEAPAASYTSQVKHQVKAAQAITKGQAVYVSSADGTNMIVSKASNATEATSSKTMGLLESTVAINGTANVVTEGLLAGLDTTGANAAGDAVWLGTDGNLIYGLTNKPVAPAHLVFIGVVTRRNANNGEIFVKVQNGFEMNEIHDYLESGVQNNFVISYESSTDLYKPKSIATLLGYTPANAARNLTINGITYDLTADRSWTINPMVYPSAGIAVSTGSSWGTSITDNSTNWNTAYGWGNHASAGYLTTATAASTYLTQSAAATIYLTQTNASNTYASLSGAYANPAFVASLAWSKITGAPAFLTGNQNITLSGDVTGSGTTSIVTTIANNAVTTAKINNGAVTAAKLATFGAGEGLSWAANTDGASIKFESTGDGGSGGRALSNLVIALIDNADEGLRVTSDNVELFFVNTNQIQYKGANLATQSYVTSQGYLTGITSLQVTNALGYTPYNSSNPSGYITGNQTITLSGDVSGSGTTSISVTVNRLTYQGNYANNDVGTSRGPEGLSLRGVYVNGYPTQYGNILHMKGWGAGQLLIGWSGTDGAHADNYVRSKRDNDSGAWSSWAKVWTDINLTNLNQLTNGPGYITGYTETDTLSSVTGRGATTSTQIISTSSAGDGSIISRNDGSGTSWRGRIGHWNATADKSVWLATYNGLAIVGAHNFALNAWADLLINCVDNSGSGGTVRLAASAFVGSNAIWHAGNLTNLSQLSNGPGYVTGGPYLPTAGGSISGSLSIVGNITVSSGNTTGGGIILADDGDIVDLNDAYCSMRFSSGVRIFSANRGGTAVITLSNTGSIAANGPISASNISSSIIASYIVQRDANGYIYANHINFNTSENENPAISSFITSNGDGWSRKSNLAHVKNSIRGIADGTWGINISGNAATSSYSSLDFRHSDRDFPSGTLVQTSINYAVSSGDAFVLEIRGNSYFNTIPFDVQIQGYIYADTIISTGGYSNGKYIDGIRAINFNGNLCFWWPSGGYWEGFNVKVYSAFASFPSNRVTSITNSTQPTTAKQVNFAPVQSLHSGNYNSYSPTLTGGGASGSWNINAASVNSRTVGNGKGNIGYFDAQGNLYINNPETYSGEVRLGAAWARGGIYTSNILSLSTGSNTIDLVYSDATRFRYFYDSNGSRFMVNSTGTPYTLIDTNARPVVYVRGQYPVLTLDHTVTSNTIHGPTIQFVYDGLSSRQWVIGTAGNGSQMDFGMSNAAYSNSNYNPHHGIGGYNGKTIMRMTETGVLIGDCGTYPTNNTPSFALQVNGAISCNDIVRTSNFRLAGTLVLSGSGAEIGNSTGARLSESYGVLWNFSNSATWHHQIINGSHLCGFQSGGGNFGNGNYYGTGDVTAYYSDERLKTKINTITDAIEKIKSLEGFVYVENDLARSLGYTNEKEQAGVSAQQIQAVLPQAVSLAPFDMQGVAETGEVVSKSGENYLTVKYDRIVPLLIEGIKEQQLQIEELKKEIKELKNK